MNGPVFNRTPRYCEPPATQLEVGVLRQRTSDHIRAPQPWLASLYQQPQKTALYDHKASLYYK